MADHHLDVHGLRPETAKFFTDVAKAIRENPGSTATVHAVFQFVITGTSNYFVDLKVSPGQVRKGTAPSADVTITYSSEKVFNDMIAGTLSPAKAVLMGKLKVSGNAKLLGKLMEEVKKSQAADAARASAAAASGKPSSRPGASKTWMSDKDASHCCGCRSVFSFIRRKHHCRLCGQIFCNDCSSGTYRGQRACDSCIKQATRLRRLAASGAPPVFGEVTSPGVLSGEMITTIGPPRLSEAPAPSAGGSTEELQPAMDSTSSAAGSLAQDRQEEGEGGAVNAEETAALNARLDALQGLVDNLQLELAIGSSHEAQVPTLFSVARSSSLLAIFIYPVMLLLSYLSWRVLPIGLISFAVLGWFSPSWWYGMFVFISSVVLALWLVHVSKSSSLETFRRRMYVYGLAFSIWADYRIVRNQTADLDEQESEVVWGVAHRRNAAQVYHAMLILQGFWIKLGQYLSTRNDLMPDEYISVLTKLQDRIRARPIAQVKETIEEEFKQPMLTLFKSIDEKALAAASIAQVHRGVLHDGTVVAIKVQHRGMYDILKNDITNLEKLMAWISLVEPSADFKKAIDEWGSEVLKELDFQNEATNLTEIRTHLKQSGLPITVPSVFPELVSQKVLVMRFIDGQKMNDTMLLNRPGFNQRDLVKTVCEGVAYQLYITGVFTGDPHPGNIMVAKRETLIDWTEGPDRGAAFRNAVGESLWAPVLIDFGLTKRISAKMRLAFAKMVVSAELLDYGGVLDAYNEMGLVLSRESASDDMEGLLYSFRKAKKGKQARKDFKEMANKKMERAQKEKDEGQGKRQVQEWPSELVFFLRTVELLQGICSLTGHQLMESMTLMARRALMSRVPIADRMHAPVHASRGAAASNPRSTLEVSLRKMLEDMVKGDALLGIQVCVWKGRSFQVDVAAGRMGQLDPRPVTPKSLFPCFSVSRLATAAVVNSFVNSGITRFSDTVSSVWQPFSAGGKQGVTVSDFLKCRSGVEGALPAVLSTYSSFSSVELDTIAAQIAERPYQVLESLRRDAGDASQDSGPRNPQELVAYLYYGWGWAAAGFIKALTAKPIDAAVADLASKCDVSEDLFLGIPAERADLIDRVACIDLGKPDESDRAGDDDARTPTAAAGGSSVDSPSIERTRSVAITSGIGRTQSLIGKSKDAASVSGEPDAEAENALGEATMATALAAVEIAGVLVEGGLENLTSLTSGGKEHIMDPRLINCHKLKHGCIPSANLYATASSLAAVGGQLCEGLREKQLSGQITSAVGAACDLLGFRPLSFHRGVLDFTLPDAAPASASSDSAPSKQEPSSLPPPTAFAMCALGGTMLFCVPSECISVAITVNQLSAKRSAALAIAKLVCRELNLGEPVDL